LPCKLQEIKNAEYRDKVVEAWAYSLACEGMSSITEVPGQGGPDSYIQLKGSHCDEARGVARLAMRIYDQMKEQYPELEADRDVVIAGALIHDVGKANELNPANQARWKQAPHIAGWPPARHSVHGWHICKTVGLPDEIAHIAIGHSLERAFLRRSLECVIVSYADEAWWEVLAIGGLLKDSDKLRMRLAPAPT
jgi:putative nucleotidyltransferase with HDIG domain